MPALATEHETLRPNMNYIDALRGWAILLVLAVHASLAMRPISPMLDRIAWHGRMGVVLFFVASALTLWLSAQRRCHEHAPTRNFFIRRFFRIAPMFYVGALIALATDGMGPRGEAPFGLTVLDVTSTFLFLHGWRPESINSLVPGGWSIAVEMTFYAALPAIIYVVRSKYAAFLLLGATLLVAKPLSDLTYSLLISSGNGYPPPMISSFVTLWFPNHLPEFVMGIIIACIIGSGNIKIDPFASIGLGCTALIMLYSFMFFQTGQGLLNNSHLFGAGFAVFALSLAFWDNPIFVNKVTCFIGKISFSIYIVHMALMRWIEKGNIPLPNYPTSDPDLRYVIHFVSLLLASVAISAITYYTIERKGIALGARIIRRLEQRAAP